MTTLAAQAYPDCMYVVRRGRLAVLLPDAGSCSAVIDEVGPGQTVGEMALLSGQPRSADVRALTEVELAVISRSEFDRLAAERPDQVAALAQSVVPRMRRAQAAGLLARLFCSLDATAIRTAEACLEWVQLERDEVLFRQGDPSDALFLDVRGRVVYTMANGGETQHFEAGPGETIGEFGLLTGAPRSATVNAVRDTALLRMTRAAFEELTRRYPQAVGEIAAIAFARQQRQAAGVRGPEAPCTAFALAAAGAGVPLGRVAAVLAGALEAFGPVLHLSSRRLEDLLDRPGLAQIDAGHPVQIMLDAWLEEQERKYRYLIYEADVDPTPWTERCLRRADTVLLLGDGTAAPGPCPSSRLLSRWALPEHTELVLLQPEAARRPAGSGAWLDYYAICTHHHLRLGRPEDRAHLARWLTGRAVGLVLGGGAARGWAHCGVWGALVDAGVPVDFVGGTSHGAIVGAAGAMGANYQEMLALATRYGRPLSIFDPTLPVVSLLASAKVSRSFQQIFEDILIEDLWRPFFCVASNLSRAQPIVFRRGLLWEAVRASMAIPGLFAPVQYGEDLLVDGGVLNNLPVDVMHGLLGGGPIIAVNVFPEVDLEGKYHLGSSISGWDALTAHLAGRFPHSDCESPPPLLLETLLRVVALNGVQQATAMRRLIDVYICPPVQRFNVLDFGAVRPIAEIGYRSTVEAIAAWRGEKPAAGTLPDPDGSPLRQLKGALEELDELLKSRRRVSRD